MFRHDVLSGAPFWALNWDASTNINTNFLKLLKFVNCKIHSSVGLREGPQKWSRVALMAHMKWLACVLIIPNLGLTWFPNAVYLRCINFFLS